MENKEVVMELLEEMENLEKEMMGMFKISDLADADDETVKMFKSYANLMKISKKLMVTQAESLDKIMLNLERLEGKIDILTTKLI